MNPDAGALAAPKRGFKRIRARKCRKNLLIKVTLGQNIALIDSFELFGLFNLEKIDGPFQNFNT